MVPTRNQFIQRLTERMGSDTTFWGAREKVFALQESLSLYQLLTGKWWTSFNAVPDILYQSDGTFNTFLGWLVPTQIIAAQRVSCNGVPLKQVSLKQLELINSQNVVTWGIDWGTPVEWAPQGLRRIILNPPVPWSTYGIWNDYVISVEGLAATPRKVVGGELLDISDSELLRLAGYCTHYLSFKEGLNELTGTQDQWKLLLEGASQEWASSTALGLAARYMGQDRDPGERPRQSDVPKVGPH